MPLGGGREGFITQPHEMGKYSQLTALSSLLSSLSYTQAYSSRKILLLPPSPQNSIHCPAGFGHFRGQYHRNNPSGRNILLFPHLIPQSLPLHIFLLPQCLEVDTEKGLYTERSYFTFFFPSTSIFSHLFHPTCRLPKRSQPLQSSRQTSANSAPSEMCVQSRTSHTDEIHCSDLRHFPHTSKGYSQNKGWQRLRRSLTEPFSCI